MDDATAFRNDTYAEIEDIVDELDTLLRPCDGPCLESEDFSYARSVLFTYHARRLRRAVLAPGMADIVARLAYAMDEAHAPHEHDVRALQWVAGAYKAVARIANGAVISNAFERALTDVLDEIDAAGTARGPWGMAVVCVAATECISSDYYRAGTWLDADRALEAAVPEALVVAALHWLAAEGRE